MIEGLFETHLNVADLDRSAVFYEQVLGLQLLYADEKRRSRFYWIGEAGKAMLGIREHYPTALVQRQHFAFQTSWVNMAKARAFLREKGIEARNFYDGSASELYVFSFMPAVSIYFIDPDGHQLELLAMLPDEPKPELGIIPWHVWEELHGRIPE